MIRSVKMNQVYSNFGFDVDITIDNEKHVCMRSTRPLDILSCDLCFDDELLKFLRRSKPFDETDYVVIPKEKIKKLISYIGFLSTVID